MDYDNQTRTEEENEKIINEEYKTWKRNTPFLYDLLISHALEWPSLTCQWFPGAERIPDTNYNTQRLLLGTHTNDDDRNYVQIASVRLPGDLTNEKSVADNEEAMEEADGVDKENSDDNGPVYDTHIKITQKIVHEGEVNRARYQFENPDIIATKSRSGEVYIFDRKTFSPFPRVFERFDPTLRLKGHEKEGYGLAWNPHSIRSNHIISAGFDSKICHWDIEGAFKENRELDAMRTYTGHSSAVEDVAWHNKFDSIFASVGDDTRLMIWDIRSTSSASPVHDIVAHDAEVNCVEFCPSSEWVLATGSGDKTAALWDLRNLKRKLYELNGHTSEILQLSWSPHHECVLATAGNDRRVLVWDLSRIGDEQRPEDVDDGPPELLFMHGGHTNKISDFGWNPIVPWMLASTAEDNIVQVWQMASDIYSKNEPSEQNGQEREETQQPATEPESAQEDVPMQEAEPEQEAKPESEPEAKAEPEPKDEPESKTEAEPKDEAQSESQAQPTDATAKENTTTSAQ